MNSNTHQYPLSTKSAWLNWFVYCSMMPTLISESVLCLTLEIFQHNISMFSTSSLLIYPTAATFSYRTKIKHEWMVASDVLWQLPAPHRSSSYWHGYCHCAPWHVTCFNAVSRDVTPTQCRCWTLVAGAWAGVYCSVSVLRVLGVAVSPSMWIITSPAPLWTLWTPQLFSCDNGVHRYSQHSGEGAYSLFKPSTSALSWF